MTAGPLAFSSPSLHYLQEAIKHGPLSASHNMFGYSFLSERSGRRRPPAERSALYLFFPRVYRTFYPRVAESLYPNSNSYDCSLWSSGDTRDTSPGFQIVDLHFDGKADTAACSEIVAQQSVRLRGTGGGSVEKGLPAAAGRRPCVCLRSSVSLGFDRGGSVTPDEGLTANTRSSPVSTLLIG